MSKYKEREMGVGGGEKNATCKTPQIRTKMFKTV